MKEQELEELIKIDMKNQFDQKKIKNAMNYTIYSRIFKVLIILSLIIVGCFYGTSFVLKQVNYNPFKEENIVLKGENYNERCNFDALMSTFMTMYFPGYLYTPAVYVDEKDVKNNDFGKYEIDAKIQKTFNSLHYDGKSNTTFIIDRSHMSIETDSDCFSRLVGEFKGGSGIYDPTPIAKETLQNIKDLPKSTLLDVSLSFDDVYSAKKVIDFMNRYPKVQFDWLALDVEDSEGIARGIDLYYGSQYELSKETEKKYPTLYLPYQFNEDDLLESYLSNLKLLLDHKEFVDVVSTMYPSFNMNALKERYEDARTNGIRAIGVRCYVQRDDLLNMIEKDKLEYLRIRDVKLSILQE